MTPTANDYHQSARRVLLYQRSLQEQNEQLVAEVERLATENEMLWEANRKMQRTVARVEKTTTQSRDALISERDSARAEVERLRERAAISRSQVHVLMHALTTAGGPCPFCGVDDGGHSVSCELLEQPSALAPHEVEE